MASPAHILLPCDKPGSLILETRRLLESDPRPRLQLADALGIPYHWLNSFLQGGIDSPSVNRIQFIYEQLAKKPVKL